MTRPAFPRKTAVTGDGRAYGAASVSRVAYVAKGIPAALRKRWTTGIDHLGRRAWHLTGATSRAAVRRRATHPSVPEGTRVYAIGDIHGRLDCLDGVLDKLDADLQAHPCRRAAVIFLGDYIDRGPASAHVLDRLIEMQETHQAICLRGNHEALLDQFLQEPATLANWAGLGGLSTLMSYGLEPPLQPRAEDGAALAARLAGVMPERHRTFLGALPATHVFGDYVFVHAGLRPRVRLAQQADEDLLWIRDDFLLHEAYHEKMVVHGHTPVMAPDVRRNRINIDTGAFATGRLTCLVLEGEDRRFL